MRFAHISAVAVRRAMTGSRCLLRELLHWGRSSAYRDRNKVRADSLSLLLTGGALYQDLASAVLVMCTYQFHTLGYSSSAETSFWFMLVTNNSYTVLNFRSKYGL